MTTSSTRRTRRSGSWRAALTVPALAATSLLVPAFSAPAAAAEGDAWHSFRGFCDNAPDLEGVYRSVEPFSTGLPPSSGDVFAGRVDGVPQLAAAYTALTSRPADGSYTDDCATLASFSQKLTVGAGTSGLAPGTPVVLRAELRFAGVLDTGNSADQVSEAFADLVAEYRLDDLTAACPPDGEFCYNPPEVEFDVDAHRNSFSSNHASTNHPDGYLFRSHQWRSRLISNTMTGSLIDEHYDEAYPCPVFPCTAVGGPGESPDMDPLRLDFGTQVVEFSTTVGATLEVTGGFKTFANREGESHTVADGLEGVRGTITGLPGSGIEVLVGTDPEPPADTTAPSVTMSAAPEPNAAGWNNSDVTVSYAATDEEAGSGVSYVLRRTTGAQAVDWTLLNGTSDADLITTEGITEVQVAATDHAGNAGEPTTRTVRLDKTAPVVTVTAPAPAAAGADGTAVVDYAATATDALDGAPALSCTAPSGSAFPVGTTSVTCTATDHAGNTAAQSFDVVVTAAPGGGSGDGGGGEVPAPTALEQVEALGAAIGALPVSKGVRQSLLSHLRPLTRSIAAEDPRSCRQLAGLVKRIDSEARKRLTAAQAADLRARTDQLVTTLDC